MLSTTRVAGSETPCKSLAASKTPARLIAVRGHNTDSTDCWIQVHDTAAGSGTAIFSVLAPASYEYAMTLPAAVGLDQVHIFASSTLSTLTPIAGNTVTIQAILGA